MQINMNTQLYTSGSREVEQSCVEWRMRMLFTLLLTAFTATSGEGTHNSEGEEHYSEGEG